MTHLRRFTTRQRQQNRASHVERTYDISAKDAGDLLVYQGGRCWICGKASGASKLLAVEHDHADDWVRGRCCSTCNQFLTRQLGDDPEKAQRLVGYLSGDTPYRRMLAERVIKTWAPEATPEEIRVNVVGDERGSIEIWFRIAGTDFWQLLQSSLLTLQTYAVPKGSK